MRESANFVALDGPASQGARWSAPFVHHRTSHWAIKISLACPSRRLQPPLYRSKATLNMAEPDRVMVLIFQPLPPVR
jgi:hypothetical protein